MVGQFRFYILNPEHYVQPYRFSPTWQNIDRALGQSHGPAQVEEDPCGLFANFHCESELKIRGMLWRDFSS